MDRFETYDDRRAREQRGFSSLVGKTTRRLHVNDDQSIMIFDCNEGKIAFETYADCCSETWFADVIGFDALIGNEIQAVETIEMSEPEDGRTRQEYDQAYGLKITTAMGVCDIVYRNSSNGYYGGEAYEARELPSGPLTEITGDWQA